MTNDIGKRASAKSQMALIAGHFLAFVGGFGTENVLHPFTYATLTYIRGSLQWPGAVGFHHFVIG